MMTTAEQRWEREVSIDIERVSQQIQAELRKVEQRLGAHVTQQVEPIKRELAETSGVVRKVERDLSEIRLHNSRQDVDIGTLKGMSNSATTTASDSDGIRLTGRIGLLAMALVTALLGLVVFLVGADPAAIFWLPGG